MNQSVNDLFRVPSVLTLVLFCSTLLGQTVALEVGLMTNTGSDWSVDTRFSFNEPSSFQYGNAKQKATLQTIAETEFSLEHLAQEDQVLLAEALRFSGVEVHRACVIDQNTCARFRAFLGRWAQDKIVRYHPAHGFKNLLESQNDELTFSGWKKLFTDFSDYPYPFSEAEVLPKVVPIDLSSIRLLDRSETAARFAGYPSRLLIASVAEDNIVEREDLAVDFLVDLQSKRITSQTLYLPKSVSVYRGIRLQALSIKYKFEYDAISNRHVLNSVHQAMKGRIWFLFRPKLTVLSTLSYVDCVDEVNSQSYLYESIDAIRALGVGSDG